MGMFFAGAVAALVLVGVCVALFPIIWLLCGGSLDGR